jgi:hypothetical protein
MTVTDSVRSHSLSIPTTTAIHDNTASALYRPSTDKFQIWPSFERSLMSMSEIEIHKLGSLSEGKIDSEFEHDPNYATSANSVIHIFVIYPPWLATRNIL